MATNLVVKATNICGGGSGGHATMEVSGDVTFSFNAHLNEIETALQGMTNEQTLAAIIRVARITRTPAQTKTALASAQGLTVTI